MSKHRPSNIEIEPAGATVKGYGGFALSAHTKYWRNEATLDLELGGALPVYTLAYRTWGRLSAKANNAVIVCHALTGSADADAWWAPLFGAGKALDPARDFIVCSNVLGSCYGSTGPASPELGEALSGAHFPALTIRDQVRAQMALADALGIERIQLVIGGSMGGLQTLEWALLDPERVESIAVIAASARHSAWCLTWSEAQRLALQADPRFRDGHYPHNDAPHAGLGAARAIAMATYRSAMSLSNRYGRKNGSAVFGERARSPEDFAVRAWLQHHAEEFVRRFDANCYLALIGAMDRHDVGHGRGGISAALAKLEQRALIVSISSDALYTPAEQRALYDALPNARLFDVSSVHGHDGFLIDAARMEPELRQFRAFRHAMVSEVASRDS
jgi:homoserine O-acetyltransferase